MNPTAFTSRAAAGLVAGIAGFASYNHIVSVARDAGEHGAVAAVLPLSIDGLIVVGTMAMIDDKRHGRRPRWSARAALGFGVIATLAANVASAEPTTTARLVAAVPAVAFLFAVEVLARRGKPIDGPQPVVSVAPAEVDPDVDEDVAAPTFSPWIYATPIGPERPPAAAKLSSPKAPRKKPPSSRDKVVAAHNRTPSASDAELAARLKVSERTVKRHRPAKFEGKPINGHKVLEEAPA